jgi:hypothetical protein
MEEQNSEQELKYCHGDKCKLKVINLALNFRTASDKELDDIVAGCWLDCKARAIRNNTEKYRPLLTKVLRGFYDYTKTEDRQVISHIGYFDAQKRRAVQTYYAEVSCFQNQLDAKKISNGNKYDKEIDEQLVKTGVSC